MGIISFFSSLFGASSDNTNEAPSSLGYKEASKKDGYNLGANIVGAENTSYVVNEVSEAESNKDVSPENKQNISETESSKDEGEEREHKPSVTYNLIILDESGSMDCVRSQTISGCNETLNSIRNTAKKDKDTKQCVSIFCFDDSHSRYIFHNVPVEKTRDITADDYSPNACTPLYDAIGFTVTQLQHIAVDTDSVGMVTIITDGYENASKRWTHRAILELIDALKKKGWVFTFIGANIDVEATAKGLGIDSYLQFAQSDEGMAEMFEINMHSQRAYSEKLRYMRRSRFYNSLVEDEREEALGAMNRNFFVEQERISSDMIKELQDNEVFVFGSNVNGQHDGGASLYALKHFGAVLGQAEGRQGQSYAIPTVGNSFDELMAAVERFNDYVVQHPELHFKLTAIGCGNAGYSVVQIAPLFRQAYLFGNVSVPSQFLNHMSVDPNS